MADARDAYADVCEGAYRHLVLVLSANVDLRELNPFDLWERLGEPVPGVDPKISILQWSIALDVAREGFGLPAFPKREVAIIGEMADANARAVARFLWNLEKSPQ